jgi:L-rhamnonate dehydratase
MDNQRIVAVEWARLHGQRPRKAGSNARLGEHGIVVQVPILRVTAEDGTSGFGVCQVGPEQAAALLGLQFGELFEAGRGVREPWLVFEYPLWDLAGQQAGLPVYALAAAIARSGVNEPFRAPCYDTSLYFDDLHLASDEEAAALIASEALDGYERGHRAFKIKVGRGARHLSLEQGTRRDIAVVKAVRAALGPEVVIMLDANNGYNLNLAKYVLAETADCGICWLEEPFHEDDVLYRDLRGWFVQQQLGVLIADGEGQADPRLIQWARAGLLDVVQYDIFSYGFTRWLTLGRELDAVGVRSAPHHYGGHYGNYAACHLAGAIRHFSYVEWDEATIVGIDASRYAIQDGWVLAPNTPGFGLVLDETVFEQALASTGFSRSL